MVVNRLAELEGRDLGNRVILGHRWSLGTRQFPIGRGEVGNEVNRGQSQVIGLTGQSL